MHPEESLSPADWLRIAEKDLNRAEYLLEDDPELAGFCLQQGAEKLLKAFLLSQGWKLRRTHNLDTLLDDAITYDPTLEGFRLVCQKATAFYFVERYPLVLKSGITGEDVRGSLDPIKSLFKKLKANIIER